ncbi:MAG: hypothetical protein JSV68_21310 [Anaerolineaceae bacterium]|nr:MAG: hypothetical protein JSV68_21310 [Anaerolineaceae bacterium]
MSELETFVLGYLEQMDSIVEPAVYGIHEVLLPEAVAERWHTDVYQRLAFADTEDEAAIRLGYNHPLVEQMIDEARGQMAATQAYINGLRLNKKDVHKLAVKEWSVVNGRVVPQLRAALARARSTYVRFNFKAAIISNEKQERLVSVLMDAHTGHRVVETELIETQASAIEPDTVLQSLPDAPIRWQPDENQPLNNPLDQRTLTALLERAKTAVLQELSDHLKLLQKRVSRFRELDEARLTEYYDELERDLQHRLDRASADRRASLIDKLEAVKTERGHKSADIADQYQVQLNLTLLNLKVIRQPKLLVPVNIENRVAKVSAYAVWDPLRHRLESLVCAVCGLPIQRVYLCHNGHLAGEDCLAPACIDCKRVFCRQCADEVGECEVCHEPLCSHSRISCDVCRRGTCQAHQGMCHANDGKPVDLTVQTTPPEPEPAPTPKPAPKMPRRAKSTRSKATRKPKTVPTRPKMPRGVPKPQRIEVVVYPDAVVAFVLASRERQIAMRVWELRPTEGLIRTCECEKKDACKANNMVLRPSEWQPIESQILQEIASFREEYGLPSKKVRYNRVSLLDGPPFPMNSFKLFGLWKDEEALAKTRASFERIYFE